MDCGDYGKQQGGTNADVVIADAIVKGLKGFDYDLAYQAIKKNAEIPSDESQIWEGLIYTGKHKDYLKRGFLYSNKACCVSYTLEFAYNDFCTSQVAKALGLDEDATRYYNRSLECYNLFNPKLGFFWAKDSLGNWMSDFDENYVGNPWWKGPYFYEGTPWHYSTYVLHDIQGLIRRHGGQENFTQYLDRLFSNNNFTIENEPDIHAPYLYNYALSF